MGARKQHHHHIIYGKNLMIHTAAIPHGTTKQTWRPVISVANKSLPHEHCSAQRSEAGGPQVQRRRDGWSGAHGSGGRRPRSPSPSRQLHAPSEEQADNYNLCLTRAPIAVASTPPDRRRSMQLASISG